MQRGISQWLCACALALAALWLAAAAPLPAWAENAAESKPPASTPSATDNDKPADTNTAESKPVEGASASQDENNPDGAEAGKAGDPAADAAVKDETASQDKQTAAANGAEAPAPLIGPQPPAPAPSGTTGPAEGAPQTPPTAGPALPASPLTDLPNLLEMPLVNPNAAEGRPASGATANLAEQGVAEPPVPENMLPTPAEEAGSAVGYVAPEMSLSVPGLAPFAGRPGDDRFIQPERAYLRERPLPPLNETETDEELVARNVEESLKLLNLPAEQRPSGAIQIPLPSGTVTFKAAQSFQFDRRNRKLIFTGDAEIVFNDIAIWADLIEVDDSAAMAYAKGYVAVQQKDDIIYCDEAYLNYDTKTLELFYIEGNTGGPKLSGTLYFKAQRAYGTFDHLIMEKAELTTCDPFCGSVDEYHLSAHKAHYKRNKSIVLYDVYAYIRSHKVAYVPVLAFPLPKEQGYMPKDLHESEIQQNYGYNPSEGWFAKYAYTYSTRYIEDVSQPLRGVVKMDFTQKRGPGAGIRQDFYIPHMGVTTIRTYYRESWPWRSAKLTDGTRAKPERDFEFELSQELNLSKNLTGSLKTERRNTFVPSANVNLSGQRVNTWSSSFNLNYRKGQTSAGLNASQNSDVTGGYLKADGTLEPKRESNRSNASFTFSKPFSKDTDFSFNQTYTASKGGAGRENLPADQEGSIQSSITWTGAPKTDLEGYSAKLNYNKSGIDYDGDAYTRDRDVQVNRQLPGLAITLPRDLINDGAYFNSFNISFDNLVSGRRRAPQTSFRTKFSMNGGDTWKFSNSSSLTTGLSFDQYWYDDGNAQYVVRPSATYIFDPKSWFKFDVRWGLQYREGVKNPPVQGDRTFKTHGISYGMDFTNRRSWKWHLSGSVDLMTHKFREHRSQFDWDASRVFGLTHTFGYDVESEKFTPSRLLLTLRSPHIADDGYYNWLLNLSLNNDIEHGWRSTGIDMKYFKKLERGWSTEITGAYRDKTGPPPDLSEDFLKSFIKKIVVRKVNCCTTFEAGWRTGINEVYLQVYLNALPQYPGTYDARRPFDDKDYTDQFFFPTQALQDDILGDVFGINTRMF